MIELKDLEIKKEVGRGSFSTVYKGYFKPTNRKVAIKKLWMYQLAKKKEDQEKYLEREIDTLYQLRHPHMIEFIGANINQSEGAAYIVTEYVPNKGFTLAKLMDKGSGWLTQKKKKNKTEEEKENEKEKEQGNEQDASPQRKELPLLQMVSILRQIADLLEYMHEQGFIHRDLKAENVLLKVETNAEGEETYEVKVCDFGLARPTDGSNMTQGAGTKGHQAPEVLSSGKYDNAIDAFSFGTILFQLIFGTNPRNLHRPVSRQFAFPIQNYSKPQHLPPVLWQLLCACVHLDPKRRPPFSLIAPKLHKLEKSLCDLYSGSTLGMDPKVLAEQVNQLKLENEELELAKKAIEEKAKQVEEELEQERKAFEAKERELQRKEEELKKKEEETQRKEEELRKKEQKEAQREEEETQRKAEEEKNEREKKEKKRREVEESKRKAEADLAEQNRQLSEQNRQLQAQLNARSSCILF